MYVLFVVLNETEYLSEILYKMKQLGIRGATVIDSMGATSVNKGIYNIPVIGGFMKSIDRDSKINKTIFSVIEREKQVDRVMEHIEKILGGDMKKPNKGIMFVLPVSHFRGGELHRHIESRENKKLLEQEFESEYY
ncbi:MAG: P-II family nitrogen regulator [Eubacteriales bacterium]